MKYIIDLEPLLQDSKAVTTLWIANGFRTLVFDQEGKRRLTPLSDDICIDQLRASRWMQRHDKEMYDHGYSDGLDVMKNTDGAEVYAEGLHDAWSAALQVVLPEKVGGKYTADELRKIFGVEFDYQCLQKYTPQEVIRMLDDLESQQAIKIGDEVKLSYNSPDMEPLVVTALMPNSDKDLLCITVRGKYIAVQSKQVVKTGRHFKQVAELLNAMRGNDRRR